MGIAARAPVATTTLHAAGQLDHCQRAWTCTGISAAQVRTRRDLTLSAYTKAAISIRIATPVWQVVEVATPWWDCDTNPGFAATRSANLVEQRC